MEENTTMSLDTWSALCQTTAAKEEISLSTACIDKLYAYFTHLKIECQQLNLVSFKTDEELLKRHFIDSLTLVPHIEINPQDRILDIGSGAGFPGLVLACVYPQAQFTLIEKVKKKARFLAGTCNKLNLKNVQICDQRIEDYQPPYRYHHAVSRAVTKLPQLITWSQPLLKRSGSLWAYKTLHAEAEWADFADKVTVIPTHLHTQLFSGCIVRVHSSG